MDTTVHSARSEGSHINQPDKLSVGKLFNSKDGSYS